MSNRTKAALIAMTLLAEATVAAAQSARTPSRDDPNRLICRRMPETGSLAQTRRQCFTRAEWDRIAESARTGAEKTIDGLTSRPGGN